MEDNEWEYKVEPISYTEVTHLDSGDKKKMEDELNEWGKERWEVVGMIHLRDYHHCIVLLKRRKNINPSSRTLQ